MDQWQLDMSKKNILKKIIKYRISYTGMKETDIIYKKIIFTKLDLLNISELRLLAKLFEEISDNDIYNILIHKMPCAEKFKNLIDKILNE